MKVGVTFLALTEAQSALVSVSATDAAQTALALPDYDSNNVVWKKVGCEFLGWYSERPLHNATPAAQPAYLVETLGDPVTGEPGANIAINIIDAMTGERINGYGGTTRKGLLGTTCGAEP